MAGQATPMSAFVFDRNLKIDRDRVLLVVYFRSNTEIEVWMPERVSQNMSDTFPADLVAAVKDFVENVPRRGGGDG